jgi:tetratricopeptide (TPR) repeat protein
LTVDPYRGFVFSAAALAEDVEVPADRRKEILLAEGKLSGTHWEVLGLPWDAPASAASAAYLDRVKLFHPDRYAGRRLGTFRGRLERVFRRITEARDVLVDPERRAEYARETAPPEVRAQLTARRVEDDRRTEERRARMARQNPLLARAARVAELVKRGKDALAAGRFTAAKNDLLLAQGLDPQNAELAALAAEARRRASQEKANEHFEKGLQADALGHPAAALAAYREALEVDARHVRAAAAAVKAALALGDTAAARALAEQAVRAGPGIGGAHEALGLVLETVGEKREARRAFERALALDPRLEGARERLKRRWSILG